MTEFKPLEVSLYPRVGRKVTDETLYWKRLSFPVAVKEYGRIDCIDFAAQEPHYVAVTCSSKIQIYNPVNNKVRTSLTRFKQSPYGGVFRADGQLLVAGSEDGFLRIFDTQSNKPLRIFKGHTAATHRCSFFKDGVNIVSFSDDKSVRVWDIPTETHLLSYQEHKDYIRAGTTCRGSRDVILSGSYDHTVKMYDTRINKCVMTVNHGAPVESVLMFPSGGLFLSSGGLEMRIWDAVAGRLSDRVMHHYKTVTCMCFASDGKRIMSGSLDRHVKIYDTATYGVVHTLDYYPSPILSVACAPSDKVVAVGMADGLISIRHQKPEKVPKEEKRKSEMKKKYNHRDFRTKFKLCDGDIYIPEREQEKFRSYDRYLRMYASSRALDAVLRNYVQKNEPEVTVYVMKELIRRGTLRAAMAGREGESLVRLVKFVIKYISDMRFTPLLCRVGAMIDDIYRPKLGNPAIKKVMEKLGRAFQEEVKHAETDIGLREMIRSMSAAASLNNKCELPQADGSDSLEQIYEQLIVS